MYMTLKSRSTKGPPPHACSLAISSLPQGQTVALCVSFLPRDAPHALVRHQCSRMCAGDTGLNSINGGVKFQNLFGYISESPRSRIWGREGGMASSQRRERWHRMKSEINRSRKERRRSCPVAQHSPLSSPRSGFQITSSLLLLRDQPGLG